MLKKIPPSLIKSLTIISLLVHAPFSVAAENERLAQSEVEKTYLVQIINQLDALQPVILSAQHAQLANQRLQFHYTRYQDNQGQWHQGLLEDVQAIKTGVLEYLHQPAIEPRVVQPLKNDYVMIKPMLTHPFMDTTFLSSKELEGGIDDPRQQ